MNPILKKKFDDYGDEKINMISYIKFLNGETWDDRFLKVIYDNVTVSLSASLIEAEFQTHSDSRFDWIPKYVVSYRSSERKCFTIDAPQPGIDPLLWSSLKLKNDIFPNGQRTASHKMKTYLHYPGQRFCSYFTVKDDYHLRPTGKRNFIMQYRVQNIAVITRRDKQHESCINDGEYFDYQFIRHWLHKVGCYPPHSSVQENVKLPVCNNTNQMKLFSKHPRTVDIQAFGSPCKVIDQLDFIYNEFDDEEQRNNSYFRIKQIYLQTSFTDKMQTRAYTLDDLVSSCGGFIGLFLGYAVIQLPQLIESLFQLIKKKFLDEKNI